VIASPRLDLLPATVPLCEAQARGPDALAAFLGVDVPPSWPPPVFEPDDLERLRTALITDPTDTWTLYYLVTRGADRRTLVGVAGYAGPPSADGAVEIGYAVAAEHQRRGYASEAVRALIERALADGRVNVVVATTYPTLEPSIGVLLKAGFVFVGSHPETGIVRYEIRRSGDTAAR
jgi:RimJ/RimL family protein N-acetyltransferase